MHISLKRLLRFPGNSWAGLLLLVIVAGCEWGDRDITLVRPDTDNLQVVYTDTVTILRSTVMKDSLYSSSGSILAGRYKDDLLGAIEAKGFLLASAAAGISLQERAVYDSLVLVTKCNYAYTDTTRRFTVSVHELLDDITKDHFFNTSSAAYVSTPLAVKEFLPRPRSNDSLRIRLSDQLGRRLFTEGRANNIKSQEALMKYFKGFVLTAGQPDKAGFVGFVKENTSIQLYYHVDGPDGKSKYSSQLTVGHFFNQVKNDRSGTDFKDLVTSRNRLSSTTTDGVSVVQSGVGLMTRLDFPFLHQFGFDLGKVIVNRAFLRIQLPRNPEVPYMAPPARIGLYTTGANNDWDLSSPAIVTGGFEDDLVYNERYYKLDVSSLMMQLVQEKTKNPYGFLIGPLAGRGSDNASTYPTTLDRLVLPKGSVKLQIYYTTLVE